MTRHAGNVVLEPAPRSRGRRTAPPRRAPAPDVILEALPTPHVPVSTRAVHSDPARYEPTHEEVRVRAYEIFLARGGRDGRDVEDWIQAERELRAERTR